MPFFRAVGTKLNQIRQVGGKVLGGLASVGGKVENFATRAAPIADVLVPGSGVVLNTAAKIAGGVADAASAVQSGRVGGKFASGVSDAKRYKQAWDSTA